MPAQTLSSQPLVSERTEAIIVAAGRGSRVGGRPKQYRSIAGKPLLRHTLDVFLNHPRIDQVWVVIHPDDENLYTQTIGDLTLPPPIIGGKRRQDSVRYGLEALLISPPERVLIHDAARPFVTQATISHVIEALSEAPAALTAVPITDTLKRAKETFCTDTVERKGLWRAQTPQGFHFQTILDLHRQATDTGQGKVTDDVALAEQAGYPVKIIPGHEENIKITTQNDLDYAQQRLASMGMWETRIGNGFDVHALEPGDHVILCGVKIPHHQTLVGHSDADVCLHALSDAIFGAIGQGDIGTHFPPDDPQWKGASSDQFLVHAVRQVTDKGGYVVNVDLTVICEHPKLTDYRSPMIARVADILGIAPDRVGIKATTTEKLGFPGRGEGIAAQAVAAVALPATLSE